MPESGVAAAACPELETMPLRRPAIASTWRKQHRSKQRRSKRRRSKRRKSFGESMRRRLGSRLTSWGTINQLVSTVILGQSSVRSLLIRYTC